MRAKARIAAASVAALVGTFVHLSSAHALLCIPGCSGNTPICNLLKNTCGPCTSDSDCTAANLPGTCVTEGENAGSCYRCGSDNGKTPNPCLDVNFPACHLEPGALQYRCTVCSSNSFAACTGHPLTPICINDAGVCGCDTMANVCSATTNGECVLDAGAAGECVSATGCDGGSCTTAPNLVCDTTRNTCVECETNAQCNADGGADAGLICVSGVCSVDAGTPITSGDGGNGDAGEEGDGSTSGDDGGSTTGVGDGGEASSDGGAGTNTGDATITHSSGSVTYPYGHVDGGGCSETPGESGAGSFGASLVTGLAALAGILSIRTRRRRNGQDQDR